MRSPLAAQHAPDFCPTVHAEVVPETKVWRACHHADGRPKRWYLRRAIAKALCVKSQSVYPCPSGTGYHIGRTCTPAKAAIASPGFSPSR